MAYKNETTTDLMNESLQCSYNFSEFEVKYQESYIAANFQDFIARKIVEKGLSKSNVIKDADLDRTYGYQIIRGVRNPTRGKLIQLAFGLKLNTKEAAELLKLAGFFPLYPKIQNEAAILFCLNKGYTYVDCMIFLDALHNGERYDD